MAHYRGYIEGSRGSTSRLGTKSSGLTVVAQSWAGEVRVDLYEKDGVDCARISVGPNYAVYGGPQNSKTLAQGPLKELRGIKEA